MINLAVIGTNWITEKFVHAAHETELFTLKAVYSRHIESAKRFSEAFAVDTFYTSLLSLAQAKEVDAVYIASPNALHCEQAILMMEHGKHVICEKPLASNADEVIKMMSVARANHVVLLEAYKSQFLPNFKAIDGELHKIGKIHKIHFNYCQYSSRYQKYLDGLNPNTFNPVFSNGSIMDIGYYCVAAAVSLFGGPNKVSANAHCLPSGVDAHGSVIFNYPGFDLLISHSKVTDSHLPSEIQGEQGSIIIKHIAECDQLRIQLRDGKVEHVQLPQHENSMYYEAQEFARRIQDKGPFTSQHSLIIANLLSEIRKQTGVIFPADVGTGNDDKHSSPKQPQAVQYASIP